MAATPALGDEGRMNDVVDPRTCKGDRTTELDALVIDAGFAGLYQLLCLRDRLGLSVIERVAESEAPGTGIAIPAHAAIPKATSTGIRSPRI